MPDNQPDNTAPTTDNATATQNPADRLIELQTALRSEEEQLGKLTKERDALKTDVESLARTVGEIDKAKAGYAKGLPQLGDDKDKLSKYQSEMLKAAEVLLGPKKDQVVQAIDAVEKKIADKKTDVGKAQELVRTTGEAAAKAQADLDKKQKDYDAYKNLEKDIGEKLQKLVEFKSRIDKLNDTPKAASMYVLLREMKSILDMATVPTQEEFEKELIARWRLLDEAKETARTTKLAADVAKTKLTAEEAALAALEKSRIDDLLAATDEFNQ